MASETAGPADKASRWHARVGESTQGPLTDDELRQLASDGKLRPESLVWAKGLPNWLPCSAIPELAEFFSQAGPSPAPPPAASNTPTAWPIQAQAGLNRSPDKAIGRNRRRIRAWHVLTPTLLLASAAAVWFYKDRLFPPRHDALISLYSTSADEADEIARIEKHGPAYFLGRKKDGQWGRSEPLRPMIDKEFVELFGEDWSYAQPLGLVDATGRTALLRVKSGWTNGDFTCTSGFFIMSPEGPIEIAQIEAKRLAMPSLAKKATVTPEASPTPQSGTVDGSQTASVENPENKPAEKGAESVQPAATATPNVEPSPSSENGAESPNASPTPKSGAESSGNAAPGGTQEVNQEQQKAAEKTKNDDAEKLAAQIRELRKQASRARDKVLTPIYAGIDVQDFRSFKKAEAALASSKEHEAEGRFSQSIEALRVAIAQFAAAKETRDEKIEAVRRSARSQLAAAAEVGPPAPVATPAETPAETKAAFRFEAVNLERSTYKHGETLLARIDIKGIDRRQLIRRFDGVLIKQNGRFVELIPASPREMTFDPPEGFHTTTVNLAPQLPPGSYRLHSSISCPGHPSGATLEHDFDFELTGSPSDGGQGEKNTLGKILDGLDKLAGSGKKRKGHSSRH